MQIDAVLAAVHATGPSCGSVRVVAIDGGAAAGKSTLAAALAAELDGAEVVHIDDLLDGWAGQFSYPDRLRAQLLQPLSEGRPGRYQRYDWVAGRFADQVAVPVPETLVVEGVSAIWGCGPYLGRGVFLQRPRATRLERWVARDGAVQAEWLAWLDAEDTFFAAHPLPAGTLVG